MNLSVVNMLGIKISTFSGFIWYYAAGGDLLLSVITLEMLFQWCINAVPASPTLAQHSYTIEAASEGDDENTAVFIYVASEFGKLT